MLLGYRYMSNNLIRLGGYPTHRDVADLSNLFLFLFCVFMIKGDDAPTGISSFKAKWDEQRLI